MPGDVLLVVADESLATVLDLALRADGYRVRTAATGDDALDALAADPPDLVILDLTTPSSETVLLALHRDRPGTPHILLVPTFGDWQTPRHPAGVVLAMPFGLAELRRALVEVPDAARKQP